MAFYRDPVGRQAGDVVAFEEDAAPVA